MKYYRFKLKFVAYFYDFYEKKFLILMYLCSMHALNKRLKRILKIAGREFNILCGNLQNSFWLDRVFSITTFKCVWVFYKYATR